ncbi:MAG: hypothetical protein ACK51K_04420, partial [Gammaproteobacteria bacterium]
MSDLVRTEDDQEQYGKHEQVPTRQRRVGTPELLDQPEFGQIGAAARVPDRQLRGCRQRADEAANEQTCEDTRV